MSPKTKRGINNINRMRRNRNLPHKQLAVLLGLRFTRQIVRYERAENLPTLEMALLLEIALGARLSELYPNLYAALVALVLTRAEGLPLAVRKSLHGRLLGKEYVEHTGTH
jgi:transcriptional regulator with XRE-family HTH domain